MATYRIYYTERQIKGDPSGDDAWKAILSGTEYIDETEWEETQEERNAERALEAFFKEHAPHGDVRLVDEDGEAREVADWGFDPDRTYLWIENGRLMEYQGLEEATPGLVSCPLCGGTGEVDESVADEYAGAFEGGDDHNE